MRLRGGGRERAEEERTREERERNPRGDRNRGDEEKYTPESGRESPGAAWPMIQHGAQARTDEPNMRYLRREGSNEEKENGETGPPRHSQPEKRRNLHTNAT